MAAVNSFDPPDPELAALAARINKQARAGSLSFISRDGDVSVILQHGSKRRVMALNGRPNDGDIGDMVAALESWSGFQQEGSPYSIEVPPLPESGW